MVQCHRRSRGARNTGRCVSQLLVEHRFIIVSPLSLAGMSVVSTRPELFVASQTYVVNLEMLFLRSVGTRRRRRRG